MVVMETNGTFNCDKTKPGHLAAFRATIVQPAVTVKLRELTNLVTTVTSIVDREVYMEGKAIKVQLVDLVAVLTATTHPNTARDTKETTANITGKNNPKRTKRELHIPNFFPENTKKGKLLGVDMNQNRKFFLLCL
ncbi:hypothetical protein K501DRAFT_272310 [Backusella circina FSU 941]|nr:hypothetical protein K501DRAFT_272310 [Backusella circina FSU 941]